MNTSFNQDPSTVDSPAETLQQLQHQIELLERRLDAREARNRQLMAAMPQIVWIAQADGSITDFNYLWYEYTGLPVVESLYWGFFKAIHPEDGDRLLATARQASIKGQSYAIECRLLGADGTYRWFKAEATPVVAADGEAIEWVGTYTNIDDRSPDSLLLSADPLEESKDTPQKSAESALRARAEELARMATVLAHTNAVLEKRNQELDQFAYVTSHDLKAPLRAIANLSQWIEEDIQDSLTDDTRHQMNLLRGRIHRMEALIDALLQYSRAGRTKTKPELVNVETLLAEIIDSLAPPPEFKIQVEPGMPALVTEQLPLQQVFTNLIGNAIKHHHRGDGQVKISVQDQGDFYKFAVADDGPGIAPQYHEKIFVIFQTLQARDKMENTGVGLALVKRIVDSIGGTIELESAESTGATFRFTWPKR